MSQPRVGRKGLSRGAIAVSLAVHAVLLTLLALTAPALRLPTADWRADVMVTLATPVLRLKPGEAPSPAVTVAVPKPAAAPAPALAARAPARAEAPPRPAVPAAKPVAAAPPSAPLQAANALGPPAPTSPAPARAAEAPASGGDVRGAVREAIGCAHETYLRLSAAERAACERKLAELPKARGATVDPIPALKRGEYDRQAARDARRRDHDGPMSNPVVPCEGLGSNFSLGCVPKEAMHGVRF